MSAVKRILPAVKLIVICVVCTLLLSATYELTRGRIEKQSLEAQRERLGVLFTEGVRFEEYELDRESSAALREIDAEPDSVTRVYDASDTLIGTAVTTTAQGYGGEIIVTAAFAEDGKIIGISVSATGETPNVGDKVNGAVTALSLDELINNDASDGERFQIGRAHV